MHIRTDFILSTVVVYSNYAAKCFTVSGQLNLQSGQLQLSGAHQIKLTGKYQYVVAPDKKFRTGTSGAPYQFRPTSQRSNDNLRYNIEMVDYCDFTSTCLLYVNK